MQNTIKNEWIYDQSPKEVWEYLTRAELIALWLMPNDFKPIPGHEFQFRSKPIPSLDLDGIFHCEVIEIVPYQKLTYSWKGGSGNGVITLDTVVEWTLEKHGNGTKLLLKNSGFTDSNLPIFTAMSSGWAQNIQKMIKYLNEKNNASTSV
jgi:uncharacterized protein YndB with AHSA1/START domain